MLDSELLAELFGRDGRIFFENPIWRPKSSRQSILRSAILKLLSLAMHVSAYLETQRIEPDKTRGIILVVSFGWVCLHSSDGRIVQAHWRFSAGDHYVSLVKLHAHRAADIFLAFGHE